MILFHPVLKKVYIYAFAKLLLGPINHNSKTSLIKGAKGESSYR